MSRRASRLLYGLQVSPDGPNAAPPGKESVITAELDLVSDQQLVVMISFIQTEAAEDSNDIIQ